MIGSCLQDYDEVEDVSNKRKDGRNSAVSSAGITCTVCHGITSIHSTMGNAAYTIEESPHYPFAHSTHPALQWVNNQMIKAKPDFHKKTFLKPFHKTAEFCSTCHKVSLPPALNYYKEYLRGQDHYLSYLNSGVSGHGAPFLLLSRRRQNQLRRLPHAAQAERRLRQQGLRRQPACARDTAISSPVPTPACPSSWPASRATST